MIPAFLADRENRKRRGELDENRLGATITVPMYSGAGDEDDDDEDEIVLETKGSSPPPMATPMQEANAQMELERARAQIEAEKQARIDAQAQAEKQARIDRSRGLQNQAFNSALDFGNEQVAGRGFDQGLVDKYGLLNLYDSAVNRAKMGIAEDDQNPMASYNTKTMFNDALDTAQGTYRGDLRRGLNDIAGDGFEYNAFADTADDSILQSILDSSRADALAQIDQAKARGQLNDVGYSRALTKLGDQAQSGMADLQDLGLGVLTGYRNDLRDLRSGELDKIGSASFDNPYSFDTFTNRLNTRQSDLNNRMRGDLFRATEGQSFFDPSSIISGSGAIQGFYNPPTAQKQPTSSTGNPLLAAFTDQDQQKKNTSTNGVF